MKCCNHQKKHQKSVIAGIFYGLLPHSFCIAFIILSVIGATTASFFVKKFLLIPYFFEAIIGLSIITSTITAIIYLKNNCCLSARGIKSSYKYLTLLYGITIIINLLLYFVIFPRFANYNNAKVINLTSQNNIATSNLRVNIPCSGHASLITDELKGVNGVLKVNFQLPNIFIIEYDNSKTSLNQLLALNIFKQYPARPIK